MKDTQLLKDALLTDRGQRNWSVFVNGVLTCLDFSDDDEEGD